MNIRERRHMTKNLFTEDPNRQIYTLESLEHGFCRRPIRSPLGVAGVQTGQFFLQICQSLPRSMFNQGQEAQSNREQANQAGGAFRYDRPN